MALTAPFRVIFSPKIKMETAAGAKRGPSRNAFSVGGTEDSNVHTVAGLPGL